MTFVAIEPAYKMVHDYSYENPTLVMATKGTIESEKFNLLLKKYDNHKTYVLPCVGLADIIEQGDRRQIKQYLNDNIGIYKNKVKNVVLGCTHYPLIQKEIEEVLGKVQFFNGASSLAKHLKEILKQKKLLRFSGISNTLNVQNTLNIEFKDSQGIEEKEKRFYSLLQKF